MRGTRQVERVVVVGHGLVSHRLCKRLADLCRTGAFEVTVVGEENRPVYDRVNLGDVLAGRDEQSLALAPTHWYAERGYTLRLGDSVKAIAPYDRRVLTRSG